MFTVATRIQRDLQPDPLAGADATHSSSCLVRWYSFSAILLSVSTFLLSFMPKLNTRNTEAKQGNVRSARRAHAPAAHGWDAHQRGWHAFVGRSGSRYGMNGLRVIMADTPLTHSTWHMDMAEIRRTSSILAALSITRGESLTLPSPSCHLTTLPLLPPPAACFTPAQLPEH